MDNIKEGDIVVCINNGLEDDTISRPMLTLNKGYIVINVERWQSSNTVYITIRNDLDISYSYYDFRFSNLREYRKLKLDRLNSIGE